MTCSRPQGIDPGQQHCPGAGDLGQERVGVEGPVEQDQHARAQQVQQPRLWKL
jgi:hypothetical protein